VPSSWIDENTLSISTSGLDLLPLTTGQHHIRIKQGDFTAQYLGAIISGDTLDEAQFVLNKTSGPIRGGATITVTANSDVILPGTKVMLRSRSGQNEITTIPLEDGSFAMNLRDDVENLSHFKFVAPAVLEPELYTVYLLINGQEVEVGQYSYTFDRGLDIQLPNYPPMVVGAAEVRDDNLFIGVKNGQNPNPNNRFLMKYGFEIYDINIWENPVRLSQIKMDNPVTGLALVDHIAYLAEGKSGLAVVDVFDKTHPYMIEEKPVSGYIANDIDVDGSHNILALAAYSELGDGFVRFFNVQDSELSQPQGYSTIVFNQGDLQGQPLDVEWWQNELYVLFNKNGTLYLAIFDQFGSQLHYRVQAVERGSIGTNLSQASLLVQNGQVTISNGTEYLLLQENDQGLFETIFWQQLDSSNGELLANGGGIFISNADGVIDTPSPNLVVSSIIPASGMVLANDEKVTILLNKLINTNQDHLRSAISIVDSKNKTVKYNVEGINTISGGSIEISFDHTKVSGAIQMTIGTELTSINGRPLVKSMTVNYQLLDETRPLIDKVYRLQNNSELQSHYFHGDGTEVAVLNGHHFGQDKQQIILNVGSENISETDIISISDEEIRFKFPHMYLTSETSSLAVSVQLKNSSSRLNGAVIVVPKTGLEDLNPKTGPPQGGNQIDIYGYGFTPNSQIFFGNNIANDIKVVASHHLRVLVPSGDFGFSAVSVINPQFPNETSVSPEDYFYAGQETGSVVLSNDNPSPVSAIAKQEQLLYVLTGGSYQAYNINGEILNNLSTSTAQLVVVDVSDPVHPQTINKEFADQTLPYFYKDIIPPTGFTDLQIDGNDLYAIGGDKLLHFDISLRTDPFLLNEFSNTEKNSALTVSDKVIYLGQDSGIRVFHKEPDAKIREMALISRETVGGKVSRLVIDKDILWAMVPARREVVAIELNSGHYNILHRYVLKDRTGFRIAGDDLTVRNNLLFVSSGDKATVELFDIGSGEEATNIANLKLSYLLRNGNISAGKMMLHGQTLYVAAGHGDLQLFDISAWLNNQFRAK
ncbi:MAG: hypothetical protein COW84_07875, partial [Gammaproteobacteria bacterium CG22_combo_CG10-13_8_21_14_all_40_8]